MLRDPTQIKILILIKNLKYIVFLLPLLWQAHTAFAQDSIPLNSTHSFKASFIQGYTYSWWYTDQSGKRIDFSSKTNVTEPLLWTTEGNYNLFSQAKDAGNCLSEVITKKFVVYKKASTAFNVNAGRDTIIGGCKPYQLNVLVDKQPGVTYSYLWKPATNINNAAIANPVFTPGSTTTFVVTVTSSKGDSDTDTVTISVSEVYANAGPDVFMLPNTTAILNGTASTGKNLAYQWTTTTGKIESGAATTNPVVSKFGDYYLKVTDAFGCTDYDTVTVSLLAQAPVANDDYDTTAHRTEVVIAVLDNDTDPQNSLNPASLKITSSPFNGTAYVDFSNNTIRYRPNENFSGNEMFEYEICNTAKLCDKATVFVLVTEFEFRIPNAFTPNGDGINDYFEIIGIEKYPNNRFTVVDRWGYRVYEAQSYGVNSNPRFWDGYANSGSQFLGKQLNTGTYYYTIDLGDGTKPIVGSIYLDR